MRSNVKEFGIVIDTLATKTGTTAIAKRVQDMRTQAKAKGYRDLDEEAATLFVRAQEYEAIYGIKAGSKPVTLKGKRFHLLCTAKAAMVLSYQAKSVENELRICLTHGVKVFFFSPYKNPDLTVLGSVDELNTLLAEEATHNRAYAIAADYAQHEQETRYALIGVLNTPTPWLGENYRLHTLLSKEFSGDLSQFLLYAKAVCDQIESQGEYDVDYSSSLVYKEKMSTAHYVAASGKEKGKRVFWVNDSDVQEYWVNYEILPVDILTKFVHLTYLTSINYKPLIRINTDGAEFDGKEHWIGTCLEDVVRVTPLYVDPYFHAAVTEEQE